jgi:glucose/arabinose dehydrogenase
MSIIGGMPVSPELIQYVWAPFEKWNTVSVVKVLPGAMYLEGLMNSVFVTRGPSALRGIMTAKSKNERPVARINLSNTVIFSPLICYLDRFANKAATLATQIKKSLIRNKTHLTMKRFGLYLLSILLLTACSPEESHSQEESEFTFRNVTTGLDTPWEVAMGPDGMLWITERPGRISRVDPDGDGTQMEVTVIDEVFEKPDDGEWGLMGLTFHPEFDTEPWVYIGYTYGTEQDPKNKIVRFRWENGQMGETETVIEDIDGAWNHDGCRVRFGPDGKLYVTMGDAAIPSLAQNPMSPNGKILRVNDDGSIPEDNPFAMMDGYHPLIYSMGHRNPQGLIWANGILYSSEHGANTDDELNIIEAGENYGWPMIEGYCDNESGNVNCSEYVDPIRSYNPQSNTEALAGIDYYPADGNIEGWRNSILLTALAQRKLIVASLSSDGREVTDSREFFVGKWGRLRDVLVTDDQRVFVAVSNRDGRGNPRPEDDRIIEIVHSSTSVEEDSGTALPFPNPVSGIVTLPHAKGKIIDIMGREVAQIAKGTWDCSAAARGPYRFVSSGRSYSLRVE